MNIVWIVLVCLALVMLEVLYLRIVGLRRVSYTRYFTRRTLYCGEQVEMVEEIVNGKLSPVPWLRVESRMSASLRFGRQENLSIQGDMYHRSIFFLRGYRKVRRRHQVTCTRRGYYNMNSVTLSVGDLLGIWNQSKHLSMDAELIVYPRLLSLNELPIPSRRWQGDVVVRRWILPDYFLINGIRDYRPGDALRDVHWRATARTGMLQVKTHDYTAFPRLIIMVNVQLSQGQWGELSPDEREPIEYCLSVAATMAHWARRNGMEVGFCCNGTLPEDPQDEVFIAPRGGDDHLDLLLETMARLRISRRKSIHSYIDETLIARSLTGMDILILSTYWSDLLEERARTLRQMGNAVVHVPVAADETEGRLPA